MSDKFPKFVDLTETGGKPFFVKIFRDQEGIKGIASDGERFNPAKADAEGSPATEEDFNQARKTYLALNGTKERMPFELDMKLLKGDFQDDDIKEAEEKYILQETELNSIGLAYSAKEKYDLAEKYFRDSIRIFPTYGDPYGNLISMYCRQKNYSKALETFNEGIKNVGGISLDFVYYHGSRTYFLMEDYYNAAFTAWEGIEKTKNDPDEEPYEDLYIIYLKSVLNIIKKGLKREGIDINKLTECAAELSKKAHTLFPDSEEMKANLYEIFV